MLWFLARTFAISSIVVVVPLLAQRAPRLGALFFSLPLVSGLTFAMTWMQTKQAGVISRLAKETLFLIPLTLLFFVPLIFCDRLGFWLAFFLGVSSTCAAVGLWMLFAS